MKNRHLLTAALTLLVVSVALCGYFAIHRASPPEQIPAVEQPLPVETLADSPPPAPVSPDTDSPPPAPVPPDTDSPPPVKKPPQPEKLLELLALADRTPEKLSTQQLVIAAADGTEAKLYAFEQDAEGMWTTVLEGVSGHVGKNGVTANKQEGDLKTPLGLFSIPFAFGIQKNPGCQLSYRQVTEESCWVDDPASASYNQWMERSPEQDWKSAEYLLNYTAQYAYAFVIGYNQDPVVSGAGSAIFFHCGTRPTAGCISTGEDTVITLLQWLNPAMKPQILIVTAG